jgi:hypothetical protein
VVLDLRPPAKEAVPPAITDGLSPVLPPIAKQASETTVAPTLGFSRTDTLYLSALLSAACTLATVKSDNFMPDVVSAAFVGTQIQFFSIFKIFPHLSKSVPEVLRVMISPTAYPRESSSTTSVHMAEA